MSQGIDIREPSAVIVEELLLDADGAIITSGAATLKIAERQSDGTLRTFDFNDNTFKSTAVTTETAAPSHRTLNNGTTNTGIWTFVQSTVSGFTAGGIYFTIVEHDDLPSPIVRKFQWGIASGSLDLYSDEVDLVDAPNATAVAAIQNGLATSANVTAAQSAIISQGNTAWATADLSGLPTIDDVILKGVSYRYTNDNSGDGFDDVTVADIA